MPEIIATVLMLLEAFNCIRPLILFPQKGQYSFHISQAQTVADLTLLNLENALHKKMYFTQEEFDKINSQTSYQVSSLHLSTNLRCDYFKFSSFQSDTYTKFITTFEAELDKAFEQMHYWKCFPAYDPQGLPENSEIPGNGNGKLEILITHYSKMKEDHSLNTPPPLHTEGIRFFKNGCNGGMKKFC